MTKAPEVVRWNFPTARRSVLPDETWDLTGETFHIVPSENRSVSLLAWLYVTPPPVGIMAGVIAATSVNMAVKLKRHPSPRRRIRYIPWFVIFWRSKAINISPYRIGRIPETDHAYGLIEQAGVQVRRHSTLQKPQPQNYATLGLEESLQLFVHRDGKSLKTSS